MITEDYVSFEIAKLLKEKGFDGECRDYYSTDGHFYSEDFKSNWNCVGGTIIIFSAPTLQMAMKWLRKVHNQHVQIKYFHGAYQEFEYVVINTFNGKAYHEPVSFSSYEEAVEAALKYALTNLI